MFAQTYILDAKVTIFFFILFIRKQKKELQLLATLLFAKSGPTWA